MALHRPFEPARLIGNLGISNERRGFVEEQQYRTLADKAAGQLWLRGLLALAYTYGFRKAELLEMRCNQVDLLNDTVCLYPGETKNGEGRSVTLTEECRQLVTELRKGKQPDDYLFTRNGEHVRDFRGTWDVLTKAAGLPGLLFHDLRRSAVRNMVRRGVPQKTARESPATRQTACLRATISPPKRTSATRPGRSRKRQGRSFGLNS